MQSITKNYLTEIISRVVNKTILTRRAIQHPSCYLYCNTATEQEIYDFIQSIPYFDESLKNFMLGDPCELTIISQAWETMFIIKSKAWAESTDWLQVNPLLSIGLYTGSIQSHSSFLTLPY